MISFGAVLGKATPGQLVWLVLLEVPVYAVNQKLVFDVFKALDIGEFDWSTGDAACIWCQVHGVFHVVLQHHTYLRLRLYLHYWCRNVFACVIASRPAAAAASGGSMSIHAFGAYFGLAASLVLSPKGSGSSHSKNNASYVSDMTAMIGTIFLWIFW
jgi:hypothetical protein